MPYLRPKKGIFEHFLDTFQITFGFCTEIFFILLDNRLDLNTVKNDQSF